MSGGLNIGTLTGILELDSKPFDKALDKAGDAPDKLAAKLKKTGDKMSTHITLPIVAAGAAAVKLGVDFDATFNKMVGLAGVSRDEVNGLKESVLNLSGTTAQAPQDLADALYFIRSAGLSGQSAMDALTESAKASAAGLGDAAVIADALTSALNAYGTANLTAAQAADVLTATAREGKAEASALAPQFGRLLPVASQLGITFDQVGAGLAFLSRSSGDASLSATQLSGVFTGLLKVGPQSAAVLDQVHMSADDIHKSLKDKGLLATLQDLHDKLGDTGFTTFFQDSQAVTAALALTKDGGTEAAQVFDHLKNSTGAAGEAFDAVSKSDSFKMQQALADLQTSLIRVGATIAPFVSTVLGGVATVAKAFGDLPTPVQNTILVFAGLLAAVGPVLSIVARLKSAADLTSTALAALGQSGSSVVAGLAGFAGPAGITVVALGALLAITGSLGDEQSNTAGSVESLTQALREQGDEGVAHVNQKIAELLTTSSAFPDVFKNAGASLTPFINDVKAGGQAYGEAMRDIIKTDHNFNIDTFTRAMADGRIQTNALTSEIMRLIRSGQLTEDGFASMNVVINDANTAWGLATGAANLQAYAQKGATDATDAHSAATQGDAASLGEQAAQASKTAAAVQALSDKLKAQFDPLFGMIDAFNTNAQAMKGAGDAAAKYGADSDEAKAANEKAAQSALGVEDAVIKMQAAIEQNPSLLDQSKAHLMQWAAQGLITEQQAASMGQQFDVAAFKAASIPTDVHTTVTANTDPAIQKLNEFLALVRNSSGMVIIGGSTVAAEAKAGGGPVRKGMPYIVTERGDEAFIAKGGSRIIRGKGPQVWVAPADGEIVPNDQLRHLEDGTDGGADLAQQWRDEADRQKAHAAQHDNMFAVGQMSSDSYLAILQTRLARTVQYSDEWYAIWQKIEQINSDTVRQEASTAAAHQKINDNRYAAGELSAEQYRAILVKRLGDAREFSDEWLAIQQQITQIDADAAAKAKAVADEHMRIHDNQYAVGDMTTEQYRSILEKRLSMQEKYSDEWTRIQQDLTKMESDAAAHRRELADNQYKSGAMSAEQYRAVLVGRLADYEQFSNEWESITEEIKSIDDRAAQDAKDAADKTAQAAQDAQDHKLMLLRNTVKYGDGSVDELKAMLLELQAGTEKFSDEWARFQDEIDGLTSKHPAAAVAGFTQRLLDMIPNVPAPTAASIANDVVFNQGDTIVKVNTTDPNTTVEVFPGITERSARNVARASN